LNLAQTEEDVVLSETLLDSIDEIMTFADYDDLLYLVEYPDTDISETYDDLYTEDQISQIE
jgi:hypothetical protein